MNFELGYNVPGIQNKVSAGGDAGGGGGLGVLERGGGGATGVKDAGHDWSPFDSSEQIDPLCFCYVFFS